MRFRPAALLLLTLVGFTARLPGQQPDNGLPRSVDVNALAYYRTEDGKSAGFCSPIQITVERNPDSTLSVGFVEHEIGSFGDMWRAAAWMSTVMAADQTGFNPSTTQVTFEYTGRIDGPSAGGLMTIGVIAALRGDTIRADSAMTGTINPDGTIGPVGGIPHKIEGAAAAGKKFVLIPYGIRTELDGNAQQDVDLFEHGSKLGVEIQAVGDLYTAYKLLTGVDLPRPPAAAAPNLTNDQYQRLRLKVDEWLVRFGEQEASFKGTPADHVSEYMQGQMNLATDAAARARRLITGGQAPTAWCDAVEAVTYAREAAEMSRTMWVYSDRGHEEAKKYARLTAALDSKIRIAADRLKQYKPRTLAATDVVLHGYGLLAEAIACQTIGEEFLNGQRSIPVDTEQFDQDAENVVNAVYYFNFAVGNCEYIRDMLEIAGALEGQATPAGAPITLTTDFYRRAAEANLNQFEKVVVDQRAKASDVNSAAMRATIMQEDENYLITRTMMDSTLARIQNLVGAGPDFELAWLGTAMQTYSRSALLMAMHYSLVVHRDANNSIIGLEREGSLRYMLDFAEDQAKRNIDLLRRHDVDPTAGIIGYQTGAMLRDRELASKLNALWWLWDVNLHARTIAYLGGFAAPEQPVPTAAN
jgi:hypothetical protein